MEAIRSTSGNIYFGDNAQGIQIQQNSPNSRQSITVETGLEYERVEQTLKEIQGYTDLPQFQDAYGENAEAVKDLIVETLSAVEKKEDPNLIKKSLRVLRDLTIGIGGSLVASGILALLGNLPI